jgi:hypothetical protein
MKNRYWMALLMFLVAFLGMPNIKAQDQVQGQIPDQEQQEGQQQANTSPGVARVSYINGQVSTMRGDNNQWAAATLNAPLVVGDKISTGDSSRAEVELDYANVLRLAGGTEASIANLSHDQIQVQVAQGLMDYWVDKDNQANLEIDTPNVAVHPLEPGVYRVEVDSASESKIIIRSGKAQVSTPQGSADLKQGEMMDVQGVENPQYQIVEAPGQDQWDKWNKQRNEVIADARSWQYDNQYYTGTENLDTSGQWQYVPGYDWCWTPYVDEGWVPYSNGNWVWEPYYGWTWVSNEPWGWAPYHYGRWFSYGSRWMWWPGPVTAFYNPIWAPAYVSFFGFGAGGFGVGFGFGFGFGRIGWLPVGPCDPFYPWYGRGFGYGAGYWNRGGFGYRGGFGGRGGFGYHMTNINNITNINGFRDGHMPYVRPLAGAGRPVYSNLQAALTNPRVRGSIVNVRANQFGAGALGRANRTVGVSQAVFRQGSFVSGHLPIVPTRASLSASGRMASRSSLPSAAVNSRRFFAVQRPAAAPRSFAQQAASVRQMVQANRFNSSVAGTRSFGRTSRQGSIGRSTGAFSGARSQSGDGAWRRFTNEGSRASGGTNNARSSFGGSHATSGQAGWRRFADSSPSRGPQTFSRPANRGFSGQTGRSTGRQFSRTSQASSAGWRRFASSGNSNGARTQFRSGASVGQNSGWRGSSSRSFGSSSGGRANWSRFTPQARQSFNRGSGGFSRGYGGGGFGGSSPRFQKPALNLRRPVVSGPGWGGSRGSWGTGYYHAAPNRSARGFGGGGYRSGGGFHGGGGGFHGGGFHGGGGGGFHGGGGGGSHGGGGHGR